MFDNIKNATWGFLSTTHILTLVASIVIIFAIYVWLHDESRKKQIVSLFFLSLAGLAAILFNFLNAPYWGQSYWDYLPLHLCSLNAMLLPLAVLTRKKWICNLLLLWSLGAYISLILNVTGGMQDVPLLSWKFFFYYFPHTLEAGIPILLFKLNLVKRDPKCIKSTLGITFAAYTVIHFINVAINAAQFVRPNGEIVKVWYMFSIYNPGSNPVLDLLYMFIPHDYFYMLLIIPIILVYLAWWYMPELLKIHKSKRGLRKRLRAVEEYYDEYEEEYIEEIIEKKYD